MLTLNMQVLICTTVIKYQDNKTCTLGTENIPLGENVTLPSGEE